MNVLRNLNLTVYSKYVLLQKANGQKAQVRQLWAWLNIIFNRVDEDRVKQVGYDRACAEWVLRNGGAVRFRGEVEKSDDYNALPPTEFSKGAVIEEIDATDSSISHYGFDHLKGCKHVKKITLHKCVYIENKAISMLDLVKDTLYHLQVSSCGNITDPGLTSVVQLRNLTKLVVFDLGGVTDLKKCKEEIKNKLPTCDIQHNV